MPSPRQLVFVRHGQTDYNALGRLNGDPSVAVALDEVGRAQVDALRDEIAALPIDLAVHTRFPRTVQTLDLLLAGRPVPRAPCPDLDDVALGEFEGASAEDYRAWRTARPQDARPRGGESRVDALVRYIAGFERLVDAAASMPLVVTHDIPIRFLANALAGDDPLDGPVRAVANATPVTVAEGDLRRAIGVMRRRLRHAAS